MSFKIDIFIRSYKNDFEWLLYCLKGIQKFAHGFSELHIAVPETDIKLLKIQTGIYSPHIHIVHEKCKGYLAQQIDKLYCDEFCNADYIMHVDSDCILIKDITPDMLFLNNKLILFREICESPWPKISAKTLGWLDEYEYMRKIFFTYPHWIYREFRLWIAQKHNMPLKQWIESQNEFSEFNTIGQWLYKYHRDKFNWFHPQAYHRGIGVLQFWSYNGIDDITKQQIERHLSD